MNNGSAAAPRKAMSDIECQFLKIAGDELAKVKMGGPSALATLLTMIASWHSSRLQIGFHDYGQRWLLEGNAKNIAADRLLRDLFGLGDPDPRKAA
ncbi:hypothetical protein [Pseudomonas sp. NFR16]|uniref:hypothetical protein n=1 Tax=Pseudomonas sp. NFR16 TaxID=1566248 RepID=UPI0008C4D875|nr:hypothetical protein [Pseudomonas sp. NFR16]SEJ50022.1 hypothetical protein SAMN03159495_3459 [Pseudomonas sp. NFR16]